MSTLKISLLVAALFLCGCSLLQKKQVKNDCKCKLDRFREIARDEFIPSDSLDGCYCLKSNIENELEMLLLELDPCLKQLSADDICNSFRGNIIEGYSKNGGIKSIGVPAAKCYSDSINWGRIWINVKINQLTSEIDSIHMIDKSHYFDPSRIHVDTIICVRPNRNQ
ncbi:MAG: hypothetical protein GC193_05670 [Cryomorphaceae bacterium]|nr:hypothetical protein [Cryomorphaceae bacterium]